MTVETMDMLSTQVDESTKRLILSEGLDPNDPRLLSLVRRLSARQPKKKVEQQPTVQQESQNAIFEFIFEDLVLHAARAFEVKEITLDPDSNEIKDINILLINSKAKSLFDLTEGPMTKAEFNDQMRIMFDNSEERIKEAFGELLAEGRISQKFTLLYEGEARYFSSLIRLIHVGQKSFLVRVTNDISESQSQHDQLHKLQDKKEKLESYIESNLQVENFAYIASHDLKAPLRTVLSFSQLIKRSSYDILPDRDKSFLDLVIQSSNNMMLLIEDLIIFSRVNSEEIEYKSVELFHFLEAISADLISEFEEKKVEIEWDIIEDKVIQADKTKLLQLFRNLIGNAIKFTENEEKVLVEISMHEMEDMYQFSVKDNGIGISEKHLEKIFGIFEKLHSKDVYSGTGLGLSICSKIVDQHGGSIWVESEVGHGSTFFFTLSKNI
jgi:signal transduction histidine kinase